MHRMLFVSLPVADLARSRAFFGALGYRFDERLCDQDVLCVVLGERHCAMLLPREVFGAFTPCQVADPRLTSQVLLALSADSRDGVDALVERALALGGREVREPLQGSNLYARAYADLDGHIWEVLWADEARPPAA